MGLKYWSRQHRTELDGEEWSVTDVFHWEWQGMSQVWAVINQSVLNKAGLVQVCSRRLMLYSAISVGQVVFL